jgi:hypothetical protein
MLCLNCWIALIAILSINEHPAFAVVEPEPKTRDPFDTF